jgi:lipoprotein-anchoring transpeptidase ErfK/SrfK
MRMTEQQGRQLAMLAALFWAVGKAMAQEQEKAPERRIVISIPDRKIALLQNGAVVKTYPVAVGAPQSPSPAGLFSVAQRLPNPTWYHPGKVVGPGKNNPLGTRWIGLSTKGYGIHGTNSPGSIGRNVSHGCIRMRNRDVEELFGLVAVGDVVELHAERDEEISRIFPAAVQPELKPKAEPVTVAAAGGGEGQ